MRTKWISHKGRKVLYSDYSNLGTDLKSLAEEIRASEVCCFSQADGTVLNLANVEGSVGTVEAVEMLKQSAVAKSVKIKKTAVLGVTGVRQLLAQGIAKISHTNLRYFDDRDSALDWLVE